VEILNLLLVGLVVAMKMWEDMTILNGYIASFFKQSISKLNKDEGTFLATLEFELFLSPHDIDKFRKSRLKKYKYKRPT